MSSPPGKRTRAFVDGVEAGVARLLIGAEIVHLPQHLLPEDAVEGAWVELAIGRIAAPPDEGDPIRRRLMKDDDGSDLKL